MTSTVLFGAVFSILTGSAVPQTWKAPSGETYRLAWHDEFEGREIDRTKWDLPIQFRQKGSLWHPSNVYLTNGVAHFDIKLNSDNRLRYQSACLRTRHNALLPGEKAVDLYTFTYGYAEVRCRLPVELKCDYWAAFWLQGIYMGKAGQDDSREGLEVDVFETFSRWQPEGSCNIALHWGGYGDRHANCHEQPKNARATDSDWHVYGVLWTEKEYVFYLDGREVYRTELIGDIALQKDKAPAKGPLQKPAYIKLSCEAAPWAGPTRDWESPLPAADRFEVDYVRVYQKTL